jgi:putative membrane protein
MSSQSCASTHILRGALAGVIGGVVASWAMNQFQAATAKNAPAKPSASGEGDRQVSRSSSQRQQQDGGDDATVKTAQAISRKLFDHDLTACEKKLAGPAVHYGYGALVGGLYGTLAEIWPVVSAGLGIPYAFALFVLGDEAAVPALGLGPPPTQVPVRSHADYLAVHILYGIVLDVVRRVARQIV